ncbi:MAG: hypothetical protein AAF362_05375, partial [Pseudomonadota bacterium]
HKLLPMGNHRMSLRIKQWLQQSPTTLKNLFQVEASKTIQTDDVAALHASLLQLSWIPGRRRALSLRYENLHTELAAVGDQLGFEISLKARAKTGFRMTVDVTEHQKNLIYDAFASSNFYTGYTAN